MRQVIAVGLPYGARKGQHRLCYGNTRKSSGSASSQSQARALGALREKKRRLWPTRQLRIKRAKAGEEGRAHVVVIHHLLGSQ